MTRDKISLPLFLVGILLLVIPVLMLCRVSGVQVDFESSCFCL